MSFRQAAMVPLQLDSASNEMLERAKGFESVRGVVSRAITCRQVPIATSSDAKQVACLGTDLRGFYSKL